MSAFSHHQRTQAESARDDDRSLFDRLEGVAPSSSMLQLLERDLADLLNTRLTQLDPDAVPGSVAASVLCYGVRDASCLHSQSTDADEHESLRRAIQRAIRHFEPRLTNPRVAVVEQSDERRTVVFRISAVLVSRRSRLELDASVEPASTRFRVSRPIGRTR